jgi:hypothetical protein
MATFRVASALTRAKALDVTIARPRAHPLRLPRPNALDRVRTLRPVWPLHHRPPHGGDARLTELLYILADCPKARAFSIHERCKAVYGKDSRF